MAYTQQQLDTLEAAIAEGATLVSYGDKRVQYRDLKEMLQIRDIMRNSLGLSADTAGAVVWPSFSKGLDCV